MSVRTAPTPVLSRWRGCTEIVAILEKAAPQ